MRGAIPPLPQYIFMAWCLVKHRDNFTFNLSPNITCIWKYNTKIHIGCGLESSGSGQGSLPCENDREPSGSIKGREFFDQLSDYQLLKKGFPQCRWLLNTYISSECHFAKNAF
jgi:hypothetical protein